MHLVGLIIKKFVTMHGHMSRCTVTCYDARSHERKIPSAIHIVLLRSMIFKLRGF